MYNYKASLKKYNYKAQIFYLKLMNNYSFFFYHVNNSSMKLCLLDIYFYFIYVIILVFGVIESSVQFDFIRLNTYTNLI